MFCAQYMQDHVVHFYHLHALDWVDVVSALKADPKKTSEIAQSISNWPKSSPRYFADVQKRLTAFVESGQLGIFANGYWGHPAYKLPARGQPARRGALPRGARVAEGDRQGPHDLRRQEPAPELPGRRRALLGQPRRGRTPSTPSGWPWSGTLFDEAQEFVEQVYIPDLMAVAVVLQGLGGHRRRPVELPGLRRPADERATATRASSSSRAAPSSNRNLSEVLPVDGTDPQQVQEFIAHSWYEYARRRRGGQAPVGGRDEAATTPGPKPPYEQLDVEQKYSWLKTPRWKGHADGGRARWRACSWPTRRGSGR